jgi:hypothetical protein
MEVDFAAIRRLDEAETGAWVEAENLADGLLLMSFNVLPHETDFVLQLPPCAPEGIVDGKERVRETPVGGRGSSYRNLSTIRQGDADADLVQPTGKVTPARSLQADMARRQPAEEFFQRRDVLADVTFESLAWRGTVKINLDIGLHLSPHFF